MAPTSTPLAKAPPPKLVSVMKLHSKLQRCLVDDRAHIGLFTSPSSRQGIHIKLIQTALNNFFRKRGIPEMQIEENGDQYDNTVANAVIFFKELSTPQILNFQGKLDNVVGKKTINALDKELPPFLTPKEVFLP